MQPAKQCSQATSANPDRSSGIAKLSAIAFLPADLLKKVQEQARVFEPSDIPDIGVGHPPHLESRFGCALSEKVIPGQMVLLLDHDLPKEIMQFAIAQMCRQCAAAPLSCSAGSYQRRKDVAPDQHAPRPGPACKPLSRCARQSVSQ